LNRCPGGENCTLGIGADNSATKPKVDEGDQKAPQTEGTARAALYSANWSKANLNNAVERFAGSKPIISTTVKG